MAEHGHYAGRTEPSNTRQGIYALAPSGRFLASVNTRDANEVSRMLERAIEVWNELPDEDRYDMESAEKIRTTWTWQQHYPRDGLVLRINSRDLPRSENEEITDEHRHDSWHDFAWNQDYAWFRMSEVVEMPDDMEVGSKLAFHETFGQRLAQLYLIDHVRGQVSMFEKDAVKLADFNASVEAIDGNIITLGITGETAASTDGNWRVRGLRGNEKPSKQSRGVELQLLGHAQFDTTANRFVSMEIVAIGERWGGTRFNERSRDLDRAPIGFVVQLADQDERVVPSFIWEYGW